MSRYGYKAADWLGWQVRTGAGFLDFDDADTDEFVGWRGIL